MAVADQGTPNSDEAESESNADSDTTAILATKRPTPISMFDEIVANRRVQQLGDLLLLYAIFTQLIRVAMALDQSWNESNTAVRGVVFSNQDSGPSITPLILVGLSAPAYVLIAVFVIHTNRWTTLRKSAAILSTLGVAVGAVAQLYVVDRGLFTNKLSAIGLFVLACLLAALLATATNERQPPLSTQDEPLDVEGWSVSSVPVSSSSNA
jgi:hypothetical protein